MKWKENVKLVQKGELQFQMKEKSRKIEAEDEYIALAVEQGISDDNKLIELVAKKENINQTAAAFAVTQFIIDYGEFIEADHSHYMIME